MSCGDPRTPPHPAGLREGLEVTGGDCRGLGGGRARRTATVRRDNGRVPGRVFLKRPGWGGRVAGEEPRGGARAEPRGEPGARRPMGSGLGDAPRADKTGGEAEQVTDRDVPATAASPTSGRGGAEAEADREGPSGSGLKKEREPRGRKRGVPK